MGPQTVQEIINHVISELGESFVYGFLGLVGFLWVKNVAGSLVLYLKIKFSDLDKDVMFEIDGENFRFDELRIRYVKVRSVDRGGVVMRIPLSNWDRRVKVIKYVIHDKDQVTGRRPL